MDQPALPERAFSEHSDASDIGKDADDFASNDDDDDLEDFDRYGGASEDFGLPPTQASATQDILDDSEPSSVASRGERPRFSLPSHDHVTRETARDVTRQKTTDEGMNSFFDDLDAAGNVAKAREPPLNEARRLAVMRFEDMEEDKDFKKMLRGRPNDFTLGKLLTRNHRTDRTHQRTWQRELKTLHLGDLDLHFNLRETIQVLFKEKGTDACAHILLCLLGPDDVKDQADVAVEATGKNGYDWYIYSRENHCWKPPTTYWPHPDLLNAVFRAYEQLIYEYCEMKQINWMQSRAVTLHPVRRAMDDIINYIAGGQTASRASETEKHFAKLLMEGSPLKAKSQSIAKIMDEDRWLIGFPRPADGQIGRGGVYDLKSRRFRSGRPKDYIQKQFVCAYIPYEKGMQNAEFRKHDAAWRAWLRKIFPRNDVFMYWMKVFASALGGNPSDLFFVMTGHGSNGKSKVMEFLSKVFHTYYTATPVSKLTEAQASSTAADPAQAQLKGIRLRNDEEPEEGRALNLAYIKARFNPLKVRTLYQNPEDQRHFYTHIFSCNAMPLIVGGDTSVRRRFVIHEMDVIFVAHGGKLRAKTDVEADTTISDHFDDWAQPFLSTLVALWNFHGGKIPLEEEHIPKIMRKKQEEIFRDMDVISGFISERLRSDSRGAMTYQTIKSEYMAYENTHLLKQEKGYVPPKADMMKRILKRQFGCNKERGDSREITYKCCLTTDEPNGEPEDDVSDDDNAEVLEGLRNPNFGDLDAMLLGSGTSEQRPASKRPHANSDDDAESRKRARFSPFSEDEGVSGGGSEDEGESGSGTGSEGGFSQEYDDGAYKNEMGGAFVDDMAGMSDDMSDDDQ